MASTGGFSALINIKENDFKEDLTSFYEFKKNYPLQYRKIVNLGDFIAIKRTINRLENRDKIVDFSAIFITWVYTSLEKRKFIKIILSLTKK